MQAKPTLWKAMLALIGSLIIAGCASTRLTSTWKSPDASGPPMRKIAVFVLNKDENLRRFAEDQAVRSLPKGTSGLQSYRLFAKPEQDIEKVRGRLSKDGYEGILMVRTVSVDKTRQYVPPVTTPVPTGPVLVGPVVNARTLDTYYQYAYGYTYQTTGGYMADVTSIVIESVLYRLPDGHPVWSAVSETRDPVSNAEMVQELITLVEHQLSKEGLIATQ